MNIKELTFSYKEYKNTDNELSQTYTALVEMAKKYAKMAYSPYSKFSVGAAVLLADGQMIGGNNQENAAYPSGLCAERVALFYANAANPNTAVNAIAICVFNKGDFSETTIPPCGSCRQVIAESSQRFNQPIALILWSKHKTVVIENATQLLPFIFDGTFLQS